MTKIECKLTINGTTQVVHPVFGEDVALKRERESGEMYFTEELEGTFKFVGADFTLISSQSIGEEILFEVFMVEGGVSTLFASSTFYKTDCTLDFDNTICEVKMTANDLSSKLRDGLDTTYNLIELAPELETTEVQVRPILQIYMLNDNKLTNVIGNMSYEVDCEEVSTDAQAQAYLFLPSLKLQYYSIELTDTTLSAYNGQYWGNYETQMFQKTLGGQFLSLEETYDTTTQTRTYQWIVLKADLTRAGIVSSIYTTKSDAEAYTITMYSGGTSVGEIYRNDRFIYTRLLNDMEGLARPSDDICSANLNYNKVFRLSVPTSRIIKSQTTSATATKWGLASNGEYFVKPVVQQSSTYNKPNVIPIGYNLWGSASIWFVSDFTFWNAYSGASKPAKIEHSIPIENAIKVLLNEIDPTITFDGTSAYSKFLFGTFTSTEYPKGLYHQGRHIVITPITNIKKTYYSQAAQKGDITLGEILEMLKGAYQLYWWVDSQKRLRIEHISYFRNGGSYSTDSRQVLYDLTTHYHPRNNKPWSFGQNKVSYEKEKLPETYEYSWSEDATEGFNGASVTINSEGVTLGQVERVSISNFFPDLDMIISAPDSLSDDIYAVYEVANASKRTYAQIIDYGATSSEGIHIDIQNPFMSFIFLIPWLHFYNLSGKSATYLGVTYTLSGGGIKGIIREKKQSVQFPCTLSIARSEGLLKTGIGEGEIRSISLNLSSLMAEADIYYDIE